MVGSRGVPTAGRIAARMVVAALVAAGSVLPVGAGAPGGTATAAPVPAGTMVIWVSPTGSDSNDGLTATTPLLTLQRASDLLCGSATSCQPRNRPVVVKLAQTVFRPAAVARARISLGEGPAASVVATVPTVWHYVDPANPTSFEPWNYVTGDGWSRVSATGGYPTFDGGFNSDVGLVVQPQVDLAGGSTNLSFRYIRWQHYVVGGVSLAGGISTTTTTAGITVVTETARTVNGVTFYGCSFNQIGNRWVPTEPLGFGAILPSNSARLVVQNSHFVQLMNRSTNQDTIHIHGIYFSHASSGGLVDGNEFTDITGDAVRQRDRSHGTLVRRNVFTRAGAFGYLDDFYCRPSTPNSICFPKEFRSYGGVFTGNTLRGLYPQGLTGRRTVFCHDQPGGLCPADRIAVR